ncbi:MAG: hypothetical protein EXS00_03865 [Phycisphaerales bacterium]|nr:hypothetical protein [Phycisphaerales bacterium]
MSDTSVQRDRLRKIVHLAQVYRGWTRAEASKGLGREFNKLIPDSGNPKLDLVVALADALDWTIGDVAESVCTNDGGCIQQQSTETGDVGVFASLDEAARACHRCGDYTGMVAKALQMAAAATKASERALAANRLAGGWDGLGRYTKALASVQTGLAEPGIPRKTRLMLQANLANAHYALWHLVEARATADDLVMRFANAPPDDRFGRVGEAFAFYVRGNSERRLIDVDPEDSRLHASRAREDLCASAAAYRSLADQFSDESYSGIANSCAGALIEVESVLGIRDPLDALDEIAAGLDTVVDVAQAERGDWLESWGWWAIFGCNIASRCPDSPEVQRHLAIFTNKASEIAERLMNWSLRERAFTFEHMRRRIADRADANEPWTLDREEVRTIAGTMGRFPAFRDVGWMILEKATVVDD